mmetsp:Transcript_33672/g.67043  ORF Transcript_33672/g.67043 Transcript_33672/m.67043 type:complete len:238 (-) Transcript_33672:813-1526(-)
MSTKERFPTSSSISAVSDAFGCVLLVTSSTASSNSSPESVCATTVLASTSSSLSSDDSSLPSDDSSPSFDDLTLLSSFSLSFSRSFINSLFLRCFSVNTSSSLLLSLSLLSFSSPILSFPSSGFCSISRSALLTLLDNGLKSTAKLSYCLLLKFSNLSGDMFSMLSILLDKFFMILDKSVIILLIFDNICLVVPMFIVCSMISIHMYITCFDRSNVCNRESPPVTPIPKYNTDVVCR